MKASTSLVCANMIMAAQSVGYQEHLCVGNFCICSVGNTKYKQP